MKKLDHTLLAWFLLVGSVIFVSQEWLRLEPTWRIVSLCSLYVASFLLIVQYSMRSLDDPDANRLAPQANLFASILNDDPSFIRKLFLMVLLAVAYTVATASACFHMTTVNELYSYIAGWAVFCLIIDTQFRIHHLSRIVEKWADPRTPLKPSSEPPEMRLHVAKNS